MNERILASDLFMLTPSRVPWPVYAYRSACSSARIRRESSQLKNTTPAGPANLASVISAIPMSSPTTPT
jgi:hypothetical protein